MHGFSEIHFSNAHFDSGNSAVIARKPTIKVGGTSLKNRKKNGQAAAATNGAEAANPWANLANDSAAQ